jgi:hypothetical protein
MQRQLPGQRADMNRAAVPARCAGLVTSAGTTALRTVEAGADAALGVTRSALRVADPRSWAAGDAAADVLPYLVYAVLTGLFLESLERGTSAHAWR